MVDVLEDGGNGKLSRLDKDNPVRIATWQDKAHPSCTFVGVAVLKGEQRYSFTIVTDHRDGPMPELPNAAIDLCVLERRLRELLQAM